jgi:hypothetical protein
VPSQSWLQHGVNSAWRIALFTAAIAFSSANDALADRQGSVGEGTPLPHRYVPQIHENSVKKSLQLDERSLISPSALTLIPQENLAKPLSLAPLSSRFRHSPDPLFAEKRQPASLRSVQSASVAVAPSTTRLDLLNVNTAAADLQAPASPDQQILSPHQVQSPSLVAIREPDSLVVQQPLQLTFASSDLDLPQPVMSPAQAAAAEMFSERSLSLLSQANPPGTEDSESSSGEEPQNNINDVPAEDPELGIIRVRSEYEDPELGVLNIREQPFPTTNQEQTSPPVAYISGRLGFVSSDNIFYAVDPLLGIVGDEFVRAGVSLSFFPKLGSQTFVIGSVDANLQRYTTLSSVNYDEVRFRLGVRQIFTPKSYGQLTWSYQQLFRPGLRNRFFQNRSVDLLLGRRDPLSDQFTLDTYYRLQFNYSDPVAFDRLIHFFGVTGTYNISPQWQTGISYQLTLADYTRIDRYDTYHQILGQLTYNITPSTRISLFGGFSFGNSSLNVVRFEDTLYGISVESTLPLF